MDTTLEEGVFSAQTAADKFGLPQTVYRDKESGGWWHTNPLSQRLMRAETKMTVLPSRYFS